MGVQRHVLGPAGDSEQSLPVRSSMLNPYVLRHEDGRRRSLVRVIPRSQSS